MSLVIIWLNHDISNSLGSSKCELFVGGIFQLIIRGVKCSISNGLAPVTVLPFITVFY